MAKMTEFEQVLIDRDGMTKTEAKAERNRMRSEIYELLEEGAGYDEIEDLLLGDCGLEMDYIFDLL